MNSQAKQASETSLSESQSSRSSAEHNAYNRPDNLSEVEEATAEELEFGRKLRGAR